MLFESFSLSLPIRFLSVFFFLTYFEKPAEGAVPLERIPESLEEAAQSEQWLRLLHYRGAGTQNNASSRIHNDSRFFLSPEGHHNATKELEATILAFREPVVDGNENKHAWCRYPARGLWISEHFNSKLLPPRPDCQEYVAFQKTKGVKNLEEASIEVIFVSGYLGNPASFFGHVLLQPNAIRQEAGHDRSRLLENVTNFGAITPKDEPGIKYVFKGLFGGYKSQFSEALSHRVFFNYKEEENRDIWIYTIPLSNKEHELLVAHLWELKGVYFRYTFALDNCSFEMFELLSIVLPELKLPLRPWSTPIDVVHGINSNSVTKPEFELKPSRKRELRSKFFSQPASVRKYLRKAFKLIKGNDQTAFEDWMVMDLPIETQIHILDIIVKYIGLLEENPTNLRFRSMALARRLELPTSTSNNTKPKIDPNEHTKTALIQTGLSLPFEEFTFNNFQYEPEIRLNLAYFDLLSYGIPIDEKGKLTAFDGYWRVSGKNKGLKSLDVIAIEDLAIGALHVKGDRGVAWRLKLRAFDKTLTTQYSAYVESAVGTSLRLGSSSAFTVMMQTRGGVSHRSIFATGGPEIGLITDLGPLMTIAGRYRMSTGFGAVNVKNEFWYGMRFGRSNNLDLRTEFNHISGQGKNIVISSGLSW